MPKPSKDQPSESKSPELPDVVRTSAGLRDALFDEINAIRNGRSNATRANAIAKLAATVVDSVRMEIEVQRSAERIAAGVKIVPSNLPQPLALGTLES